jgi:hypothetical protein
LISLAFAYSDLDVKSLTRPESIAVSISRQYPRRDLRNDDEDEVCAAGRVGIQDLTETSGQRGGEGGLKPGMA